MKNSLKNKMLGIIIILMILFLSSPTLSNKSIIAAKVGGYNTLKVLEKARVSVSTSEFSIYETKHFIIKYKEEDKNITKQIGEMYERSYVLVGQAYNYYPEGKTTVLIYPNYNEFWRYQPLIRNQEIMGLYNAGVIHILSPNAYQSDEPDFLKKFEKDGPILHEYTHKVLDDLTGGNIELWLTEGIAIYEEYAELGTEWAPNFKYERYYSYEELQKNFMKLDEVQGYRQSFDIVRGMVKKQGREGLKSLLTELKNLNDFQSAYKKVYGDFLH